MGGKTQTSEPSGYLGDLNEHQEEQLALVKKMFAKDENHTLNPWMDDMFILRFLRFKKFNADETWKMMSKLIEWRDEEGIDTILTDYDYPELEETLKCYPKGFFGTNKQGRPFWVENLGVIDAKALFEASTLERMKRRHYCLYEEMIKLRFPACSLEFGRQISRTYSILDLKGMPWSALWNDKSKKILNEMSQITAMYYPECMGKMLIVNGGLTLSGIWAVIKGWLDEKTRNAIVIWNTGYEKELRNEIEMDVLPKFLGGDNEAAFGDDVGPWNKYEIVDSTEPGATVGIRLKSEPEGKIFTSADIMALPNDLEVKNGGVGGSQGACIIDAEGKIVPKPQAEES